MTTALEQLVQLPCVCGCGRTAATLRLTELPEQLIDLVGTAIRAVRAVGGAELRQRLPKIPEGVNPLAAIPVDMLAGALGVIRPECALQLELSGRRLNGYD